MARSEPYDPLDHVEDWIFDLDNTLYPARSNLFAQVDVRMGEFIHRLFDVEIAEARRIQKSLFRDHGTTLRGLMTVHGIEPAAFLDYVHDIDVSVVDPSPTLDRALADLPGRKFVFTNGSLAHAERVLARLGVAPERFHGIFDIVAADYRPKPDPEPYAAIIRRFAIRPDRAAMVEDMARNLKPAREQGMTTVWVRTEADWARAEAAHDFIDHVVDDCADWLASVVRLRSSR